MPIDTDIEFPAADVRAMFAAMGRAQTELGKGLGNAVRMAGFQLCRALGTSTAVSKTYREYRQLDTSRKNQKKYEVTSYAGTGKKQFVTYKKGVRELKQSSALIGNRGLAKGSWMWGAKAAGQGSAVGKKGGRPSAISFAQKFASGEAVYKGEDPYIKITNRLPYIREAMGGGEKPIEDALRRAAKGLEIWIDNELKKMQAKAVA